MEKISTQQDLINYLKKYQKPVAGVGVTAFNRLGLDEIWPDYKIIAHRKSHEDRFIKKEISLIHASRHIKKVQENTLCLLQDSRVQKALNKSSPGTGVLIYKSSRQIESIAKKNNWKILSNPASLADETLENKVKFRKILTDTGIKPIPGETSILSTLNFANLKEKYGNKFVLQLPDKGGGKGTAFINNENDFVKFINNPEHLEYAQSKVVVTKFINASSPSITVCITRQGILFTRPQQQIIDAFECTNSNKGSGLFCGNDLAASATFSNQALEQMYKLAEIIGKYLQNLNYLGIFGLDLLLDKDTEQAYVVECNPRLLGVFPLLTMAQKLNKEIPLLAIHCLEFLKADYRLDVGKVRSKLQEVKPGAQIVMSSKILSPAKLNQPLKSGIYTFKNKHLRFLRPGFDLKHLKNTNEFLLADGVPRKKTVLRPGQRLFRVLTLETVLEKDHRTLKPKYSEITNTIYNRLKIKPI